MTSLSALALPDAIDRALDVPELAHALTGAVVRRLSDGATLYDRHGHVSMVPASNLKSFTAAAALTALGPAFRYRTTLLRSGDIDASGTLHGDLYLRGSGDPTLTSEGLRSLIAALKDAGIRRVTGRIVGDGSAFDDKRLGYNWAGDEEPWYYSAQVAGLNCDENVVSFTVAPGAKDGDPARIGIGTGYAAVVNEAATGGTEPAIETARARARNEFRIAGTIPAGAEPVTKRLTVEDPARFAATRFMELALPAGIGVGGGVDTGTAPDGAVEIAAVESRPLSEILKPFLKDSNNLYGEALLKTVGRGAAADGVAAVREMLGSWGIDTAGFHQYDGSGLSRTNTVPPRLVVDLLAAIETQAPSGFREAFLDALPVAGVDGTLENRMKGTAAEGRVRAKTGSLDNTVSLGGYVETRSGERLAFAILSNHFAFDHIGAARRAHDALAILLAEL